MKILIADDDIDVRDLLKEQIRKVFSSVQIVEAGNGRIAIAKFEMHKPIHLVITDFQMPVGDGNYVCTWIREMGYDIPIICVTSDPLVAYKAEAKFTEIFDKRNDIGKLIEYLEKFGSVEALGQSTTL